jgi:predicted Zn-dependent peptidase
VIRIRRIAPLLCAGLSLFAQDFQGLQQKVTDFTLPNGFRFVIVERHDAPVISFVTYVAAGIANDIPGFTGLATFFERIALKGTETIGTRDAAAEKKALDAVEEAYSRLDAERAKGRLANELELVRMEVEAQKAVTIAQGYSLPLDFQNILEENGATAGSTRVTADATQTQLVLPSNRAELWFLMESQRISRPVFRDFYRERDQTAPDYRNRVDMNAPAKLYQTLAAAAFTAHPYRNPAYGWPAEFSQLRHSDARQFHARYYVPGNITIGIAGDIRPDEARRLAEKYFGPIPGRPAPPLSRIQEPPQTGPRTVVVENALEPLLAVGFKRPDHFDRDDPVLEVARVILAGNRSSMLPKEVLDTRRSAGTVTVQAAFPGGRSPSLFTIMVSPLPGHTAEENEKHVGAVLARLQNEPVDETQLASTKVQLRSAMARRFADNSGIASTLAFFAAEHGDWRKAFAIGDAISKVTAAHVQLAATKYFVPSRRTTVWMVAPAPARVEAPKGAPK